VHIVAYELFFSTPDLLSMGTAAWAAPVSPDSPLGFAWAKPRLAAALAGCLLANFNACAAQLGAAAGCGRPQPPRPHRNVIIRKKLKVYKGSSAMPHLTS